VSSFFLLLFLSFTHTQHNTHTQQRLHERRHELIIEWMKRCVEKEKEKASEEHHTLRCLDFGSGMGQLTVLFFFLSLTHTYTHFSLYHTHTHTHTHTQSHLHRFESLKHFHICLFVPWMLIHGRTGRRN